MVWRLDFIVNMREELEGRALKHFYLLKDLSGCWTQSQCKGGQSGGSCESPGMVAKDVKVGRTEHRTHILKAGLTEFAAKRRSYEGKLESDDSKVEGLE